MLLTKTHLIELIALLEQSTPNARILVLLYHQKRLFSSWHALSQATSREYTASCIEPSSVVFDSH